MVSTIVGVMGPGEGASERIVEQAYDLGQAIAEQGWMLLTGGRNAGVMDAANRGAKAAGGMTIGILPTCDRSAMSDAVDIPIVTGLGSGRNWVNVLSSQVIVACGMGPGTASEVALAIKAGKPVILLAIDDASFEFFVHLSAASVQRAETVAIAISQIRHLLVQSPA